LGATQARGPSMADWSTWPMGTPRTWHGARRLRERMQRSARECAYFSSSSSSSSSSSQGIKAGSSFSARRLRGDFPLGGRLGGRLRDAAANTAPCSVQIVRSHGPASLYTNNKTPTSRACRWVWCCRPTLATNSLAATRNLLIECWCFREVHLQDCFGLDLSLGYGRA